MSDTEIKEHQTAPDFTLPAIGPEEIVKDGQVRLSDLKDQIVVLYFYPKDDTTGCTKEACNFRDIYHTLQQRGVVVLGVSPDSVASHQKFADKYGLPFSLLADTETTVSQLYGVYGEKSMYGRKYMGVTRATFLIDKNGVIQKIWPKVKPEAHADEVLQAVDALA